jgi:hypothetical protein
MTSWAVKWLTILAKERYGVDLLECTHVTNCKPAFTPMCVHEKLSRDIGEANILTCHLPEHSAPTWPDLPFTVKVDNSCYWPTYLETLGRLLP